MTNTYDPEVEEIDAVPFEGKPDFNGPQATHDGKQDD